MNDITDIKSQDVKCNITTYADDTNMLVTAASITDVVNKANLLMVEAGNWFLKNKLILNSTKSNIMLFKTNRGRTDEPQKVSINSNEFELKGSAKFLGVVLENTLCWDRHVDYVEKKLSAVCYSFRVLGTYLDIKTKIMLYHANFESHIRYGLIFYGCCGNLDRILTCQKRALRTLLNIKNRESCREKFRSNKVLTVFAMYIQECLLFFYKNRNFFRKSESQGVYQTRSQNYIYPNHRLALTEKGAYYSCIRFYNSLPASMKAINNIKKFKKSVFQMLVDIEPYNLDEYCRIVSSRR